MLLAECKSDEVLPETSAPDCLRLRISNTGGDHYVSLPLGKTTIGSSPRCNIRIQEPGVQPVHCLIVREAAGLSVRRWAAGTRLNGDPFDEAPLQVGDRLTVGAVELELEDPPREAIAPEFAKNDSTDEVIEKVSGELAANTCPATESHHDPSESAVTGSALDSKFDKLVEATTHLAQQKAALASDIAAISERLTAAEQSISLHAESAIGRNEWSQLTLSRDELKRQQDELERRFASLETQLESHERRLGAVENQLRSLETTKRPVMASHESRVADEACGPTYVATGALANGFGPGVETGKEAVSNATTYESLSVDSFEQHQTLPLAAAASPQVPGINSTETETLDDEMAPFAEFSIWKQGAANDQLSADAMSKDTLASPLESSWEDQYSKDEAKVSLPLSHVGGEESAVAAARADSSPAVATTSFIERYSHLFAEENATPEDSHQPPPPAEPPTELTRKPRNMDIVRQETSAKPAQSDEDESIEQYMAKLLERVRGDSPRAAASQAPNPSLAVVAAPPSTTPAPVPKPASAVRSPNQAGGSELIPATAHGLPPVATGNAELLTSLGTVRRKAPAMEDATDLATLRALANETARRAISTHGLQKHRRNAITKVIVSMLAGMTSLWLMLEAPNSQDLQFITACVSLMIAVYWTGQTFCELIEAFRAASYDGPEDELEGFADALVDRSNFE